MCRVDCTFTCLSVFLDLRFLLTCTSAFLQFPLTASPSASCYNYTQAAVGFGFTVTAFHLPLLLLGAVFACMFVYGDRVLFR